MSGKFWLGDTVSRQVVCGHEITTYISNRDGKTMHNIDCCSFHNEWEAAIFAALLSAGTNWNTAWHLLGVLAVGIIPREEK